MQTSALTIYVSFLVGTLGFALLSYGKKQSRIPQMATGVLLMAYPYFVESLGVTLGLAVGLIAAMWLAIRYGL